MGKLSLKEVLRVFPGDIFPSCRLSLGHSPVVQTITTCATGAPYRGTSSVALTTVTTVNAVIKRPGVAGAVLQSTLSLIH